MNKYFYRVVFNRVRGMLMVVSEITKNHQGNARSSQKVKSVHKLSNKAFTLKPMVFMSYLALGLVSVITPSYAGTIIVDKNAENHQRPIIAQTDKGATQVNIAAPNKNGVSHNKYNQFDVDKNGVILNNTKSDSRSRLGGNIKGNALLQETGSAKIILNEVNSKDPSKLNGYIEVAGKKAQVIIANPAGITCDGCSFINADRATLTTGKALFENDQLVGYRVEGGNITITGDGLDSSAQDYTDIIARSVNVNAELWASDLKVITGLNEVTVDGIVTQSVQSEEAPEFAIDVSALGGMYAGKIELIGTESGVGVHNAGYLGASSGELTITTDGKIINGGTIQAASNLTLTSQELENRKAKLTTEQNLVIKANNIVNENAELKAESKIVINAENIKSNYSDLVSDNININANVVNNEHSKFNAKHKLSVKSNEIHNQESKFEADDINLTTSKQQNIASEINGDNIDIYADTLNNKDTVFKAKNELTVRANNIENISSIYNANNIIVEAQNIHNLLSDFHSLQQIDMKGEGIINHGANFTADSIYLHGYDIDNGTTLITGNKIRFQAYYLRNYSGYMNAFDIVFDTNKLYNDYLSLVAYNNMTMYGNNISNNSLTIEVINGNLIMAGGIIRNQITALTAHGDITIKGTDDSNDIFPANSFHSSTPLKYLTNEASKIVSGGNILIKAESYINNHKAIITSGQNTVLTAKSINNTLATILSENSIIIRSNNINNSFGNLKAIDIDITSDDLHNNGTEIIADNKFNLVAKNISNKNGSITAKNIRISADKFTHEAGNIKANEVFIYGNNLNNYSDIEADNIHIELNQDLKNFQTGFIKGYNLFIKASEIDNFGEDSILNRRIYGLFAENSLIIKANTINNYPNASILSNNELEIFAKTINNYNGRIYGKGSEYFLVDEYNKYDDNWF